MKGRVIPLLLILALSVLVSFPGGSAVNACLGQCWYSVSPPVFTHLGSYQAFKTTWVNLGNANVTGVVVMVIHNSLGQTAAISTALLNLAVGANGTAYPVAFGLAPGEYSSSVFVVTTGGVAISATMVASFTV